MVTGVREQAQIGLEERVIEDDALLMAIMEQQGLKDDYADARERLKDLIEENPDLRGEFRVGKFKVKVTRHIGISITIPKTKARKE